MKSNEKNTERFQLILNKTQRRRIEDYAWDQRMSISEAIRQLIDKM